MDNPRLPKEGAIMDKRLPNSRIVGTKQTLRAIKEGAVDTVYVAQDADKHVISSVVEVAKERNLDIVYVETMLELGNLCGIDVKAATACVTKE